VRKAIGWLIPHFAQLSPKQYGGIDRAAEWTITNELGIAWSTASSHHTDVLIDVLTSARSTEQNMKRYSLVPPGGGTSYDWTQDHTFVKVSSADTGGAFMLMEDNLKREFALGLLEGNVDFYIDGDWMSATPATTVHIPPGIPHAVILPGGQTGKMLMIFQPSGFDQYLAELARMTEQDFADKERMRQLDERFDIIALGGVPPRG
jgi:hypothetical protein